MIKGIKFADIQQLQVFLFQAQESALMTVLQVEVDDTETLRHLQQQGEDTGPDQVDTAECQLPAVSRVEALIRAAHLARLYVRPAIEYHLVIEKQVTLCLATAHQQQRIGCRLTKSQSLCEIKIAEDIHIMDQDGRLGIEEMERLPDLSAVNDMKMEV